MIWTADGDLDLRASERTVPSAYWLENRGEGVTGNGMLAISPRARRILAPSGTFPRCESPAA